ncbi:MAG: hypothetical protein ACE5IP_01150 [Terriglobia bacterium]
MSSKQIARGFLFVLLSAALLWAGDPWKEKPYTDWTWADIWKVLEDSPWVKHVGTVSQRETGLEQEAKGREPWRLGMVFDRRTRQWRYDPESLSNDEHQRPLVLRTRFIILWLSSLTVRQALVANRQLYESGLSLQPKQYMVAVYGSHKDTRAQLTEEAVRQSAYLQPRRSRKKIAPTRAQFMGRGQLLREVRFYFPRAVEGRPAIGTDEKKVRFFCQVGQEKIKVDFNLRKMVRDGKPDL